MNTPVKYTHRDTHTQRGRQRNSQVPATNTNEKSASLGGSRYPILFQVFSQETRGGFNTHGNMHTTSVKAIFAHY